MRKNLEYFDINSPLFKCNTFYQVPYRIVCLRAIDMSNFDVTEFIRNGKNSIMASKKTLFFTFFENCSNLQTVPALNNICKHASITPSVEEGEKIK